MSNEVKPDGWIIPIPDDYSEIHLCKTLEQAQREYIPTGDGFKPVCLISPQELSRLRAIAEWAREIEALFLRCLNEYDTAPAYDFWLKKLQAITAPVEAKL